MIVHVSVKSVIIIAAVHSVGLLMLIYIYFV